MKNNFTEGVLKNYYDLVEYPIFRILDSENVYTKIFQKDDYEDFYNFLKSVEIKNIEFFDINTNYPRVQVHLEN